MNYNILVCGCSASSADAPRIPDMSNVHLLSIKPWATKQCKVIATSGFEAHCSWTFGGHTWVRLWSRWLPKLFSVGDPILNLYCACRCTAGLVSRGLTWALGWLVFWGLGCEEIDGFHSSQAATRIIPPNHICLLFERGFQLGSHHFPQIPMMICICLLRICLLFERGVFN